MKKFTSIFVSCILIMVFCLTAFAADKPDYIRVGLVSRFNEVSSISIGDRNIYVGSGQNQDIEVSGTSLKVVVADKEYVDSRESFDDIDDAYDLVEDFESDGYDAAVVYFGRDDYGVYIYDDYDPYDVADEIGGRVISTHKSQLALKDGNDTVLVSGGAFQISSADDEVTKIGSYSYRGIIEFGRYSGSLITAVSVVDIDEYVYSVAASEMPSSWHEEALKAQCVAARTYALYNVSKHSSKGYNLCDGTDCQVYGGYGSEKASVTEAAKDTAGEVMYYDGKPILASFSSSSGGHTSSSQNVWTAALPYLSGVRDSYEKSPTWTKTFTASEIEDVLDAKGVSIGSVKNMAVTKTADGGRCFELTIVGTKGTKTYTKEAVRTFFSATRSGSLPSTMFTINGNASSVKNTSSVYAVDAYGNKIDLDRAYVYSASGETKIDLSSVTVLGKGGNSVSYGNESIVPEAGDYLNETASTFIISGKGNGHGVGLSQYGAKGMAENGFTYIEILEHYYTGVEIE